ncbi:MAG: YueI family protein [Eubacteriales bacterium]|nr:YueI family protein [Eubacteriales bacterium]
MKDDGFSNKSSLEQALLAGIYGPPELKKEERQYFLGQFRERVIKVLTFEQIAEPGTYPEIQEAMAHPLARRLIISRRAILAASNEYLHLARKHNLAFTTVDNPEYKGPVGLVVAAEQAVDAKEITIPSRRERLLAAGIPEAVIEATGQRLCKPCLELLKEKAPQEVKNYRRENFVDRLLGNQCPCKR